MHQCPEPRDVNHVILSGRVISDPTVIMLKSQKKLCLFTLLSKERYTRAGGEAASHDNPMVIEAIGMKAEMYARDIRRGDRYVVSGYLRVDDIDGVERTRVRAYNVQKE